MRPAAEREPPRLDPEPDRPRHRRRVLGARDRARAQHGVAAELHRERRVGGGADAGVEDHRHARVLADQAQVVGVQQALAGADRGAERHHRGAADVLQPAREDRVVVRVGQHGEAVVDELLGGLEQRGRVGQQRVLVADHLELDPVGLERLAGELGGQDRVAGGEAAGGVGEQLHAGVGEHVDERAARAGVDAPQRDGDELGAARLDRRPPSPRASGSRRCRAAAARSARGRRS